MQKVSWELLPSFPGPFNTLSDIIIFFKRFYLLIFLERGERREKVRERSMCETPLYRLPLARPQLGGLVRNRGLCPDREWNW